jgi:hypothetical protein
MHKSATKCNETIGKWCKNKHGASKIIDTFETYQPPIYQGLSKAYLQADEMVRQRNLHGEALSETLPALIVSAEASGSIPASVLDGVDCDLLLDGGERRIGLQLQIFQ